MNISLIYNDPHLSPLNLNIPFMSFLLPFEQMKWVNFAIQMVDDRISFFHNCIKIDERNVSHEHKELIFESSSIFYLAQAGSILKGNFEVSILKSFFIVWIISAWMCENVNWVFKGQSKAWEFYIQILLLKSIKPLGNQMIFHVIYAYKIYYLKSILTKILNLR